MKSLQSSHGRACAKIYGNVALANPIAILGVDFNVHLIHFEFSLRSLGQEKSNDTQGTRQNGNTVFQLQ